MLTSSPALPEDVEVLFQLNKELIDKYEDISSIDYDRVLSWVRRNIETNLSGFSRVLWDNQLAGFYSLFFRNDTAELDSLFVLPQFQNQGIGTSILKKCQCECPSLFLYVFCRNTGAVRLYTRMGFHVTENVGHTRYIMTYENQGC